MIDDGLKRIFRVFTAVTNCPISLPMLPTKGGSFIAISSDLQMALSSRLILARFAYLLRLQAFAAKSVTWKCFSF